MSLTPNPTLTLSLYRAQSAAAVAPEDVLVVDIEALARDPSHRTLLLDRAMRTHDMDNERFLRKVRERLDRCAAPTCATADWPHASWRRCFGPRLY